MKCARNLCTNDGPDKFCDYHKCQRCGGEKSSNDSLCSECQERHNALDKKRDGTPAPVSAVKDVAMSPLDMMGELVGMKDVKERIRSICYDVICMKKQRERGIVFDDIEHNHFAVMGNPGTGKTTIAKMLGRIFHAYGVIESPNVSVIQREDLVAGYIGQTAIKAKKMIEAAKGGICFVDEAYRLTPTSERDFGIEAIEEIMKFMTEPGYTFIFAGYPGEMAKFIASNPGIKRRTPHIIEIRDYTHEEIAEIFAQKLVKSRLTTTFVTQDVVQYLKKYITKEKISQFNAALATSLFHIARREMNSQFTLSRNMSPPTELTKDHIRTAVQQL